MLLMPNLDGIEAMRHIREYFDSVPIVTLKAFADDTSRDADCFAADMDALLAKPIQRSALRNKVHKHCT
jgi:CheY-like chemotaxis protein